jgi:Glyoxalase/Bleomycin resistance protein/Dioxygenase superfamily
LTGTGTPYYHIALLVDDLQAGVEYWTGTAEVGFHPPVTSRLRLRRGGSEQEADIRLAFSAAGPPWIELIEACAHEPFTAPAGGSLHHVGFVAAGDPGPGGTDKRAGGTYVISSNGEKLAWFSPPGPDGLRIERVSPSYYAEFAAWLTRLRS